MVFDGSTSAKTGPDSAPPLADDARSRFVGPGALSVLNANPAAGVVVGSVDPFKIVRSIVTPVLEFAAQMLPVTLQIAIHRLRLHDFL